MLEWKQVPGFGRYEASNDGQIRRKDNGRVVKQNMNWNGYMTATLRDDNDVQRHVMVARIVLSTFEPCTADTKTTQVDHINTNKTDNRWPENLRWATAKENKRAAVDFNPMKYRRYYNERPVVETTPAGEERYYHSIAEASKAVISDKNLTCARHSAAAYIWYAINGRFRTAYGNAYRYAGEKDIIKYNK